MVFRCATLSSWLFYGKVATWQPQNFLNVRLRCQQRSIEICGYGNPAIKGSEKIPGTRMESFQSELRIFFLKSLDNLCWSGWPIDRFLEGEGECVCVCVCESVWEREREGRERVRERIFEDECIPMLGVTPASHNQKNIVSRHRGQIQRSSSTSAEFLRK